jgi:hypothetical protein
MWSVSRRGQECVRRVTDLAGLPSTGRYAVIGLGSRKSAWLREGVNTEKAGVSSNGVSATN